MKKWIKKALLSMCAATTVLSVSAATIILNVSATAEETLETTRFEMVDGASIRMANPKGLRFIAEMGSDVYTDLTTEESGVTKKMGMYIVPAASIEGVTDYSTIEQKLDYVFYASDNTVENKIYEKDGYYRANGVIANLYLQNYGREFVGIGYISETSGGTTKYTYTDINETDNVRTSIYVATMAYQNYLGNTEGYSDARAVFEEYIEGAHLATLGMTETRTDGVSTYTYNGATYNTVEEATEAASCNMTLSIDKSYAYVKAAEDTYQLTATIMDNTTNVTIDVPVIWTSSNEAVATVDTTGKVTATGNGSATITAKFLDQTVSTEITVSAQSFETVDSIPTYFTAANNAGTLALTSTVSDGSKGMVIPVTGGAPSLKVPVAYLGAFFEDPNVEYVAFDAKTDTTETGNFRRYTMRTTGALGNECYEPDQKTYNCGIKTYWKTFYFSRTDYEAWVANGIGTTNTSNYLIITGGFTSDDNLYVDNIRPVDASAIYGFEGGGLRTGGTVYFYTPIYLANWSLAITGTSITDSQLVEGNGGGKALQWTRGAGSSNIYIPKSRMMLEDITATGYVALDLYVPEGADTTYTLAGAATTWPTTSLKTGAWNTIYIQPGTKETILTFTDTTGGTYKLDNIRRVTEEEFKLAAYGFEISGGGLRTQELTSGGVAYYYAGQGDHAANKYSIAVSGSAGILTEASFDSENTYSGTQSLKLTKNNGYIYMGMRTDTQAYADLKNGFTFWMYSTVGINGTSANNIIDGFGAKFQDVGKDVKANTWTKVIVEADDINANGRFLIIQGSTAGTIYIDNIKPITDADIAEAEKIKENAIPKEYKITKDGDSIVFANSTHTGAEYNAVPTVAKGDTEDMSYIRMGGTYGLNDYLVFDFTGDNIPFMSFFTTLTTADEMKSIFNQQENADNKGWIVANGITTSGGRIYGDFSGAHGNGVTVFGEYKISYNFDNNPSGTLSTIRSRWSNSPIGMVPLRDVTEQYRMIVGFTEGNSDEYMALNIHVFNVVTGEVVVNNYKYGGSLFPKADWEGDIALYGHFGRKTTIDKLYGVEQDTTMAALIEKYTPDVYVHNGAWDGDTLTLAQGTHGGSAGNIALNNGYNEDIPYIELKGDYHLNDYLVFDFTGDNLPWISFFNNKPDASPYNWEKDTSVTGWVIANGARSPNGTWYGGETGAHASRVAVFGPNKMTSYDGNDGQWRWNGWGSAASPWALSMRTLQSVTDTYRVIVGVEDAGDNTNVWLKMCAYNLVTGEAVFNGYQKLSVASYVVPDAGGSIVLYGRLHKDTVISNIHVEENTSYDSIVGKYFAKDVDYSGETDNIQYDNYAYAGAWDTSKSGFDTYANAGLNVVLAQKAIDADSGSAAWNAEGGGKEKMDAAHEQGLKVILTDWHLQILSTPIVVDSEGPKGVYNENSEGTQPNYRPWILQTDLDNDNPTGEAAKYIQYLKDMKITPYAKFANEAALDAFIESQLFYYKDHPAFYGVMLGDEPSYHNAYCYGKIYESIKRVCPEAYIQYNLLPLEHNYGTIQHRYPGIASIGSGITNAQLEAAYKSYVETFLDVMDINYVQYDDYPFKAATSGYWFWESSNPYVDPTALRNIQIIAEIAKERDLAVKVVTQTLLQYTNSDKEYQALRVITEDDARWLNNYLLGFGVKQINYFTYCTKEDGTSEFFGDGGSFINTNGSTNTTIYNIMKGVIEDTRELSKVLMNFDYVGSKIYADGGYNFSSNHIDWGSFTQASSFRWLTGVDSNTDATLITELYDDDKHNYMYMFMNTIDPYEKNGNGEDTSMTVDVTFNSAITGFYVYDQYGNRTQVTGNTYSVTLTAGQAVYLLPY